MISYAQNREDALLARLFAGDSPGRYVDVGASGPVLHSVTKHFYDRGWSGINIEPVPEAYRSLYEARPRDTNLSVAAGRTRGQATLWIAPDHLVGLSTIDPHLADTYQREDLGFQPMTVDVVPLADILDEHPGPIDFLKVDVEESEADVLAGADWDHHRPRVVLVEATVPNSQEQNHHLWEHILTDAGYRFTLFDGLNRFYVEEGDKEAYSTLSVPANVFDDAEPYAWVKRVGELDAMLQAARQQAEQLQAALNQEKSRE